MSARRREPRTTDPDYWPAKRRAAEHRLIVAAKTLARNTSPNGHPPIRTSARRGEYEAALPELLDAVAGYQGVISATPREHRP